MDNKSRFAALAESLAGEIELVQITREELLGLSDARPADHFAGAPEGALPPPHVADRALKQLDAGVPAFWCLPFLIVAKREGTVLGACTFKGGPSNGEAHIAYGIAKSLRGRGIATEALTQLLKLVAAEGSVQRIVAEILPSNIASSRLVSRLGFLQGDAFVDEDGETVVPWNYAVTTPESTCSLLINATSQLGSQLAGSRDHV